MAQHPAHTAERTYRESARDALLVLELDAQGYLVSGGLQIEPEVMAWTAEQLAERIMRLYKLALMRCRCDERRAMNERGADYPPDPVWPSQSDIDVWRARYIDF